MKKTCTKCGEEKEMTDFLIRVFDSGNIGTRGVCNECRKKGQHDNYLKNAEVMAVKSREYYSNNKLKCKERNKKYYKEHPGMHAQSNRKYYQKNKDNLLAITKLKNTTNQSAYHARIASYHAIERGILKRQPCETCGTIIDIQGHHDDYLKPLEIRWLCRKHHQELHLKKEAA